MSEPDLFSVIGSGAPDDMPPIPTFLRRSPGPPAPAAPLPPRAWIMPEAPGQRTRRAERDEIALEIRSAVRAGAYTFQRLRKRLGARDERSLRSGLRLALRLSYVRRDGRRLCL